MIKRILKSKSDIYIENHGVMGNADDYLIYHMKWIDFIIVWSLV